MSDTDLTIIEKSQLSQNIQLLEQISEKELMLNNNGDSEMERGKHKILISFLNRTGYNN